MRHPKLPRLSEFATDEFLISCRLVGLVLVDRLGLDLILLSKRQKSGRCVEELFTVIQTGLSLVEDDGDWVALSWLRGAVQGAFEIYFVNFGTLRDDGS